MAALLHTIHCIVTSLDAHGPTLGARTETARVQPELPWAARRERPEFYPPDCLVFVRNLHPDTNKTTLKVLFSQAFPSGDREKGLIDYVDFTKGLDTVRSPTFTVCDL